MSDNSNVGGNNTKQSWENFYNQSDEEFEAEKANYIKMEDDRGRVPNAYLRPGKDDTPENFYNVWNTNARDGRWTTDEFIREDYRAKIDKQPPEEEFARGLSLCVRKFNPPLFWLDKLGGDDYLKIYGIRFLNVGIGRVTTLKQNGKLIISLYYWNYRRGTINRRKHRDLFIDFARHLFEWLNEDWEVPLPDKLVDAPLEINDLTTIETIEPKQLPSGLIDGTEEVKDLNRQLCLGMLDRDLNNLRGYKYKYFQNNTKISKVVDDANFGPIPSDKTVRKYREETLPDFLDDDEYNYYKSILSVAKYEKLLDEVNEEVQTMIKRITENGYPWEG